MTIFSSVSLAVLLFFSTNIDDMFVLLSFNADRKFRAREIVIGQYLGIGILFGLSLLAALSSKIFPKVLIGLLGLVPIAIGTRKLFSKKSESVDEENQISASSIKGSKGRYLTVLAVTLANGADNVAAYTFQFAAQPRSSILVIGLVFVAMTGLWCFLAHWLVKHPKLGAPIRRFGHRIASYVLIALGVIILFQAGALELLIR